MSIFIPDPVIKRLPMYYRYFKEMERENKLFISSTELARRTGLTASQVRQDVNAFGGEGRQGCGYPVSDMRRYIGNLLGLDQSRTMVIVGMGNLGKAIMHYTPFSRNGFQIVAAFECDPQMTGMTLGTADVYDASEMEKVLPDLKADIAVLTLPAEEAQQVSEKLYRCGVRGFWNFAPVDLKLPADASVVNVHLDESLELLSYRLTHPDQTGMYREG